jgi:sarcosine oxidase
MSQVVVVGAGCFGAWTAYQLAQDGHDVTLVDAYGPGNTRASSGGETRIIRMGYGAEEIYTRWSMRSLALWQELSARAGHTLFHQTGVLWMARDDDSLSAATLATLERTGVAHERLTDDRLKSQWPQIDFRSITWAIHEPESGVLMARRAVAAVVREAERAGARYVSAAIAAPGAGVHGPPEGGHYKEASESGHDEAPEGGHHEAPEGAHRAGHLDFVRTQTGESIEGATFVFACGPWLPKLFPALLLERIVATRQEVLYFGPPAGDARFAPPAMPAWIDFGAEVYGVPDIEGRGFKISVDRHGTSFDPDTGDRVAGQTVPEALSYLRRRFPAFHDAPLVASEVCQYENTCNGDFLIDRHPDMNNVWLVGGGSGHGFKHGPAVGEYVARLLSGDGPPEPRFSLATKDRVSRRAVY